MYLIITIPLPPVVEPIAPAPPLRKKGEVRKDGSIVEKDGVTRPFCKAMLELNRLYSKEEILEIDRELNSNVW